MRHAGPGSLSAVRTLNDKISALHAVWRESLKKKKMSSDKSIPNAMRPDEHRIVQRHKMITTPRRSSLVEENYFVYFVKKSAV